MPACYKFTINTELLRSVPLPSFLLEIVHLSLLDIEIKITICSWHKEAEDKKRKFKWKVELLNHFQKFSNFLPKIISSCMRKRLEKQSEWLHVLTLWFKNVSKFYILKLYCPNQEAVQASLLSEPICNSLLLSSSLIVFKLHTHTHKYK